MELAGLHHVSAITGDAEENLRFYTQILGLRLVKKTVNQDNVSSYHLFYGDEAGNPGTEVTFFDWPGAVPNRPGSGEISTIALSVKDTDAVNWWFARLADAGSEPSSVYEENGLATISFTDPEGQRLKIVGEPSAGKPWSKATVPVEYGIRGMHHVTLTVRDLNSISHLLVDVLGMRKNAAFQTSDGPLTVFETGHGGAGASIHVLENSRLSLTHLGAGGVHHVALRTSNVTEQTAWMQRIQSFGLHTSGLIDRFYFNSIYFRESGGILFEIATDGPGFASDEDSDHLGEKLSLPPFLEPRRASIESALRPI